MRNPLSLLASVHSRFIFKRRADVLSDVLSGFMPNNASVLDIGCGNGSIGRLLKERRPDVDIRGIEVQSRRDCLIQCSSFDGRKIPYEGSSFDVCLIVDVLHHTQNIGELLKEAGRTCRRYVVVKDHLCENRFDYAVLKFMDWIGNRPYGVKVPYNFQSRKGWDEYFSSSGLKIASWVERMSLYVFPLSLVFGRGLHFVAVLEKNQSAPLN